MSLPAYAMNQESFPEMYEHRLVGPLFRPWAEILLDRAQLAGGERVLDIACGTGIVARLAKERLGPDSHVVGVDASVEMLAVARNVIPSIDWRQGNADALPVSDEERFEAIFCHQGLQFFPDKPAALHEMRRVIADGGRLGIGVWGSLETATLFRDLGAVAERRLGPIADRRHSFGDPDALGQLIAGSGFDDVRVEPLSLTIRIPDASVFVHLNARALVGMSAASKTMSEEERASTAAQIVEESEAALTPYRDGEGVAFELGANIATARAA